MRDNVKGGALTEVTFFILLSLYTPRHGYAITTAAMLRASSSTFLCWVSRRPGLILISLIFICMVIVLNAKIR